MHKCSRVLALGVFDLFHVGHLRYLQQALSVAEADNAELWVAVLCDEAVRQTKGRWPVIPESQRLELVAGVRGVSHAELQPISTHYPQQAIKWIRDWQIDHVVAGGCWQGAPHWQVLAALLEQHGITLSFARYQAGISTTALRHVLAGRPAVSTQSDTDSEPDFSGLMAVRD